MKRAVIEDRRASTIGGINIAFEIWEASVLSMLAFNSETWINIPKKTVKVLNDLVNSFFRSIFRIGTGCPVTNFYWQCGSLKIMNYILQRKLNFIHHLANLPLHSLAGEVFVRQEENSLTNTLLSENQEHLACLNFAVNRYESKPRWKSRVRKYTLNLNCSQLLEESKTYKKISYLSLVEEEFKRKPYFYELKLADVRDRFRISSKMVEGMKANFPSKYRKNSESLKCVSCKDILPSNRSLNSTTDENLESQSHFLEICPVFSDLRSQYDTNSDLGLVEFFKAVVSRRVECLD